MGPYEKEFMATVGQVPEGYSKFLKNPEHRDFVFEQLLKLHRNTLALKPKSRDGELNDKLTDVILPMLFSISTIAMIFILVAVFMGHGK